MKKVLLYLFTFLATQYVAIFLVIGAYMLFTGGDPAEALPPLWNIGTMVAYSLAVIVVFLSMGWFKASRRYLQSHPWSVLFWSVVAALGAIIPSMVLQGLLPEWTGWAKEVAEDTSEQIAELMGVPGGYMVIALLPPLVEEMVFRGCILRALLTPAGQQDVPDMFPVSWKRQALAITISALIFAVIHMNPAQMPHTFLIGLLLGWMYVRTGSIVPGVVYHWANNTAAYVLFHVYHNPETLQDIFGPDDTRICMALLFSLCIFVPAIVQLHLRMKRV